MSAVHDTSPQQLAELLMIAAIQLADPDPSGGALVPIGVPVRRGRLYLGRLRTLLDTTGQLTLGVGFATACWIGPPGATMPELGQLRYATNIEIEPRGRIVLDRRVRSWLANTFSKALAQQLAPRGIRVNAVAPGPTWTAVQVTQGFPPEKLPRYGKDSPIGRAGQPAELAPVYVFLASGESSFVIGETLNVNVGESTP
jgi:Enoyl-(Acyl carrier protein) reductase